MDGMKAEIEAFLASRESDRQLAAQRVALRLICGLDFEAVLSAGPAAQEPMLARIQRLMARERRRGLAGHWSYDLNRHIALQQAALRLRECLGIDPPERRDVPWRGRRATKPSSAVAVVAKDAGSDNAPNPGHGRHGKTAGAAGAARPSR